MPLPQLTIAIPAWNEQARIGETLRTVTAAAVSTSRNVEILVIDDGSTDDTAQVVGEIARENVAVRLLRNNRNLGLGASLKKAIKEARGEKFMVVPGDNDMPLSTISALLRHADQGDMVMCFFLNREQRGLTRHVLSTVFGLAYTVSFGLFVEYINGPCIYPTARLQSLSLVSTRFSIVAEINVKLLRQGLSFCEVPSYRQTGMAGSTSFSLRNLVETISVFCRLFYEVHFKESARFSHRPIRVTPEFLPSSPKSPSSSPN